MTDMTAFMERLLEPLPPEELVDMQYNMIQRQARWKAWRKAYVKTRYFRAKLEWQRAQTSYHVWVQGVDAERALEEEREPERKNLADLKQAIAEQIFTPAPDKGALRWKKAEASHKYLLPISAAQIEQVIADDEAWLAAHPAKRPRRA